MVGHLDAVVQGQAPELHGRMDELDRVAEDQAQVAEWFGETPANPKACSFTSDKTFCDTYHTTDPSYYDKVHFWATPTRNCRDGRGNVCVDYSRWVQAWTEIKG